MDSERQHKTKPLLELVEPLLRWQPLRTGAPEDSQRRWLIGCGAAPDTCAAERERLLRRSPPLRRREAQAHVVRRPAPVGAAEVRPELGAHRVQQPRAVARGGEEALPEGLEPVAEVARERRRARDEGDRAHDEAVRLEPCAVLVVAGEVPGLDAALVDALARERPAQR